MSLLPFYGHLPMLGPAHDGWFNCRLVRRKFRSSFLVVRCELELEGLCQKVWTGQRINKAEALELYRLPLAELGHLAHRRRELAKANAYNGHGNRIVTYAVDRNINYTNVCCVRCEFCAFSRAETDPKAYVISHRELDRKIEETLAHGGTQILLQGGHHPRLPIEWYLDMLAHIKSKYPTINIHGFSPAEFVHFQRLFDLPLEELLRKFIGAGLGSIPGGGAEILVDSVRNRISPGKATAGEWLDVVDTAHRLGLHTTATMMFGHIETIEDRIEHLDRLRRQQDKSLARKTQAGAGDPQPGHFTAFICWTFQPANTRLPLPAVGGVEYLRTQAIARIFLDNFENVQASWVTQGPEIGQIALKFGANDLGSVMLEENVVREAGPCYRMTVSDMRRLISDLGYKPRQRDNWYRLIG